MNEYLYFLVCNSAVEGISKRVGKLRTFSVPLGVGHKVDLNVDTTGFNKGYVLLVAKYVVKEITHTLRGCEKNAPLVLLEMVAPTIGELVDRAISEEARVVPVGF